MNVRFAEQSLRCRVSTAEVQTLLTGRAISLEVVLPQEHVFRLSVRPSALNHWQLASDPTGLWLSIPRAELEALAQTLPSKEGIAHNCETANGKRLEVMFEVDVKKKREVNRE